MQRRTFVKGALSVPLLAALPKFLHADELLVLNQRFVEVKAGDNVVLSTYPHSNDIGENGENEDFWVVVNGRQFPTVTNMWGTPVPLEFRADRTETLDIRLMCRENVNGTRDNFADLNVTVNGSPVFTRQQKAAASRSAFAVGTGTAIVGGAAYLLGCVNPGVAPFCAILYGVTASGAVTAPTMAYVANDPADPDFRRDIHATTWGEVPALRPDPFNIRAEAFRGLERMMAAGVDIIRYGRAMRQASDCAQGAMEANDLYWEFRQRTAAHGFCYAAKQAAYEWREGAILFKERLGWGKFIEDEEILKFQQALFDGHSSENNKPRLPGTTGTGIREYLIWFWQTMGMDGMDLDRTLRSIFPVPAPKRSGFISLPPGYVALPAPPRIFPDVVEWIADRVIESVNILPNKPRGTTPDSPWVIGR
jgi:hypothetical protein